jgi:diguanylate cyclase (GGDEF)-like protein/PAS domain S-box-containing protein
MNDSSPTSARVPETAIRTAPPDATGQRLTALSELLENLDEAAHAGAASRGDTLVSEQSQFVQARLGMAGSLFAALRAKHAPTAAHSLRVALGCSSWAQYLEINDEQRDEIEIAALLHDVGKIGVPDHVLLKPGNLSHDEMTVVERHLQNGVEILRACCGSQEILDIVHHVSAWFDGSRPGFDRGGERLPLGARLIAIVDAFDAMTTDHVYRRAMSRERALAELFEHAGTQFDPRLVRQFCELLSSDRVKFGADVARRWLQDLHAATANSLWHLGKPAPANSATIDNLFHEKLLDTMHDGVVFIDPGMKILLWNRAAEKLTGISSSGVYQKKWLPSLVGLGDERDADVPDEQCPLAYAVQTGVQAFRRMTLVGRDQQRVAVDAQVVPVVGRDGTRHGATLLLHDASSQITLEERVQLLHEQATRDPLTQVANRAEFDRVHELFVQTHLESGLPCSLIICDLDHFKRVNDTYGHQAGDEALVSFAALLRRWCRAGDLVARYGGEEFVMLCADCDNATATQRADELRKELSNLPQPMLNGKCLTASFGVTEVQGGDTPETMLRRSDRALLQAKDLGRNTVVQLGSGIRGEESTPIRRGWFSWFQRTPPEQLLERKLVTAVPMQIATEKLRGFVADHHAEIISVDENRVTLSITGEQTSMLRRLSDRPVPFLIELTFEETCESGRLQSDIAPSRTLIQVVIRPRRSRDRRRRDALERARNLIFSLKSYLMAHDFSMSRNAAESPASDEGVLHKAKNIFSPLFGKKN